MPDPTAASGHDLLHVALSRPCRCGASVGESCRTPEGEANPKPHILRVQPLLGGCGVSDD